MEKELEFNGVKLIKGFPYFVKFKGQPNTVRRIFKGNETGICNIPRFVFSSKVKREVYAEVKQTKNGVTIFTWKNTQSAPLKEVSIPAYDLEKCTLININA